jgi:hypothetical protein
MSCEPIVIDGKVIGIGCSRGKRPKPCVENCGRPSAKLCDFPLRGRKRGQSCDRPICAVHATAMGNGIDYCRTHADMVKREKEAALKAIEDEESVEDSGERPIKPLKLKKRRA